MQPVKDKKDALEVWLKGNKPLGGKTSEGLRQKDSYRASFQKKVNGRLDAASKVERFKVNPYFSAVLEFLEQIPEVKSHEYLSFRDTHERIADIKIVNQLVFELQEVQKLITNKNVGFKSLDEKYETPLLFNKLEKQWREETETVSSISRKIAHPCYLKIIAMGPKAVPLILESLKDYPNHWFPALAALTDANPVSPGSSFREAVEAWLEWGKERGLVS